MAVLISKDRNELIVTCDCGCEDAVHFRCRKDDNIYWYQSFLNGSWYREQEGKFSSYILKKIKKIWAIIRNKDYYYSEILMNKEDFETFREWVNEIGR